LRFKIHKLIISISNKKKFLDQWKESIIATVNKKDVYYNDNVRCLHPSENSIFFSMALPANSGPRPLIQFCNHFSQTVGPLGLVIRPSQGRYLNKGQHKHRINAYTHQTATP
jgi:hypothetical protein